VVSFDKSFTLMLTGAELSYPKHKKCVFVQINLCKIFEGDKLSVKWMMAEMQALKPHS